MGVRYIGVKLSTGAIRHSKTRLAQTAGRGGARAAKLIMYTFSPEKVAGELPDSAQDLASFRGYRILHGTSLLGGRTRVTALAVEVLRPAPVS